MFKDKRNRLPPSVAEKPRKARKVSSEKEDFVIDRDVIPSRDSKAERIICNELRQKCMSEKTMLVNSFFVERANATDCAKGSSFNK